ncbi:hypothetical protein CEXT_610221 [Caerostris extrusa]|uniref:C2H2-type domain-containing protein n=1 Tax=Caerostris extrusa TaxID=172846 RepID=A0AAV4XZ70_CAEEX|nr:hypothetical protein CEXT_610221 [Caerostris extrusa]
MLCIGKKYITTSRVPWRSPLVPGAHPQQSPNGGLFEGHDRNWPPKNFFGVRQVGAPSGALLDSFRSASVDSMVDRDVLIAMDNIIDNLPCTPSPTVYPCDLENVSQLVENAILQTEVIDTVSDLLHCVSQGLSPLDLIPDASSPPALPCTFFQDCDTLDDTTCIAIPSDFIYDESSPLAMPHTFFSDGRSENPTSPSRPSCDTASSVPTIASPVDAVDLFPSELEVRDLFSDPHSNLRFDFVHLTCRPCKKRFFSAGGLENHLFAVHNVRPDTSGRGCLLLVMNCCHRRNFSPLLLRLASSPCAPSPGFRR